MLHKQSRILGRSDILFAEQYHLVPLAELLFHPGYQVATLQVRRGRDVNDIPPASSKLRSLRVERGDDDTRFFADIESIANILDRDGSNDEVALGEAFCTYGHCSSRAVVDAEFSLEAFLFKVTHRKQHSAVKVEIVLAWGLGRIERKYEREVDFLLCDAEDFVQFIRYFVTDIFSFRLHFVFLVLFAAFTVREFGYLSGKSITLRDSELLSLGQCAAAQVIIADDNVLADTVFLSNSGEILIPFDNVCQVLVLAILNL